MLVKRFFFWYTSPLRKIGNERQVQNFILSLLRHLFRKYLAEYTLETVSSMTLREYLTSPNNIYPNWYIRYVVDLWLFVICPLPLPEFTLQEKRGFIWLGICKAMKQDFPFFSQTHVKAKAKSFAKNEIEHRYCFPLNYDRYIAITNLSEDIFMGMKCIIWEKYPANTVCTA